MERTFYLVVGLILTGFFGFFALWTKDDRIGMSRTTEFWIGVGGTAVGVALLLMFAVSSAVATGRLDRARRQRHDEPAGR